MNDLSFENNLRIYNSPGIAEYYSELNYLSPCERMLFQTYIQWESAVLELGVGGGRTTGFLARRASRYLGIDYAISMVESCQTKFPDLKFMVADAADLSAIGNDVFDVVVFAYNGLDFVLPEAARAKCLAHVSRVLRPGGRFIFSSHNARAVLNRPSWNRQRLEEIARRTSRGVGLFYVAILAPLTVARASLAVLTALVKSISLAVKRILTRTFWDGQGCLMDSAHGGLLTHYAVPQRLIEELQKENLHLERVMGDDYPRPSHPLVTDWYYYVFSKPSKK